MIEKFMSLEAEAALLGSVILRPEITPMVLERIEPQYFASAKHKAVFIAIRQNHQDGKAIDLVGLRDTLVRNQMIEEAGGVHYLVRLAESVPHSENAEHYMNILINHWRERQLYKYASDTMKSLEAGGPVDEKMATAESRLLELLKPAHNARTVCVADAIDQIVFDANSYMSTGFSRLDDLFYGMGQGDMITIAGRPSSGKSCLMVNIASKLASQGKKVLLFSLEMTAVQLQQRMLCSLARVNLSSALGGDLTLVQHESLETARKWMRNYKIYIDDNTSLSPSQLRLKIMQMKARHGIDAVFIDYLQLMRSDDSGSLHEQVTQISKGLKSCALEFQIPIVVAAQLNRKPEDREEGQPRVSDLRDSGSIEQDSDIVVLIHRKDMYSATRVEGCANVIVGKNRRGKTGIVPMTFLGQYTLFIESE